MAHDEPRPLTVGSLFSGVGGFDLGFEWAGYDHRFFAEIDPYCRAVLAARFPGVPIYEDVKDVDASAGYVDVLIGGFPCQDLSVAGKRAGLAGERSGLFWEFMRIVDALHPRAVVLENVEGLYSSGSPKGADFGVVLDTLAELRYLASWRTLDAQHFGVPQRRRRVFVCAIAESDPAAECVGEVLAVGPGCDRHLASRPQAWPLAPAGVGGGAGSGGVVGALTGRNIMRLDDQCAGGGHLVPAITRKWAKGSGGPAGDEHQNPVWSDKVRRTADDETYYVEDCERGPLKAGGAGGSPPRTDRLPLIATTVMGDVTHTFTHEGHDASEDGTGRDTPIISFYSTGGSIQGFARDDGLAPTLTVGSGAGIPSPPAVAYRKSKRAQSTEDYETWVDDGVANTLNQFDTGDSRTTRAVAQERTVRRLTEVECERLMAWPDGWTDIPWNKKDHAPASRRYAAAGNGVVASVSYWIAARLAEVLR